MIRGLKNRVEEMLRADGFHACLSEWSAFRPRQVISPLFSFLCSAEELVKWRAVTAMGLVTALMADEEMEAARNIMRRLIWSLNDESGGIGWGCPEAMGEIMACHERLANEFVKVFASYIIPEGNPLNHPLLERGALWGLGRLASVRPHLLLHMPPHLHPFLKSSDPFHRGLAARALACMDISPDMRGSIEPLLSDPTLIRIYENDQLADIRICDLAERAAKP